MDLEVLANNGPAIRSYERAGFVRHELVMNGWNQKWLMRQKDTDGYAPETAFGHLFPVLTKKVQALFSW